MVFFIQHVSLHRITEYLRLERSSGGHPYRTGCSGPCAGNFWWSSRRRFHNFSGQCVAVCCYLHSKDSDRISDASVCAHCLMSCHRKTLERALPPPLRYLWRLMNAPLSLPLSMPINSLSFLTGKIFQIFHYLQGLLQYLRFSIDLWSSEMNTVIQLWPQ